MKTPTCAVCAKKPVDPEFRPFCSRRCADIDLGRWLNGSYAIPAVENEEAPSDEDDWRPGDR
jgi:endogenous inhibitor of DNA gyrase (YacG/DUF329 family)